MRSLKDSAVQHALELQRLFFHVAGALLVGATYMATEATPREALIILAPFAIGFSLLDIARQFIPVWGRFCAKRYTGKFMREDEQMRVSGMTYSLIGMVLSIKFFSRDVAAASILLVGFIDPAARVVGVLWGRIKIGSLKKTFAGTFGGLCAGLIVAAGVALHTAPTLPFVALVSGGVSASIVEVIGGRIDNLLIPLTASSVMWAVS